MPRAASWSSSSSSSRRRRRYWRRLPRALAPGSGRRFGRPERWSVPATLQFLYTEHHTHTGVRHLQVVMGQRFTAGAMELAVARKAAEAAQANLRAAERADEVAAISAVNRVFAQSVQTQGVQLPPPTRRSWVGFCLTRVFAGGSLRIMGARCSSCQSSIRTGRWRHRRRCRTSRSSCRGSAS